MGVRRRRNRSLPPFAEPRRRSWRQLLSAGALPCIRSRPGAILAGYQDSSGLGGLGATATWSGRMQTLRSAHVDRIHFPRLCWRNRGLLLVLRKCSSVRAVCLSVTSSPGSRRRCGGYQRSPNLSSLSRRMVQVSSRPSESGCDTPLFAIACSACRNRTLRSSTPPCTACRLTHTTPSSP